MANILDSLKELIVPSLISKAAEMLGESESGISKTIGGLLPTILGGMVNKASDSSGFGSIFNMLKDDRNASFLDNLPGLIGGGNLAHGDPKDIAGGLMGSLFGSKVGGILDGISSYAGVKKSSASSLLGLAGPLIMGFLGKKIKSEGLNAAGLASLLLGQKDSITKAIPGGLGSLLGFASPVPEINTPTTSGGGGNRWLWPLLLLGALALGYFLMKSGCGKKVEDTAVQTTDAVQETVTEAADATTEAVSGLGDFFTKKLACGVELNIPNNGVEAQVVTFIEDANRPVDKTTWFDFDRLTFATGSNSLDMAKSEEQLKNIAEILKCYPKAKFRIGGYTDNVGKPEANMKLSQERANSVSAALTAMGIAADRVVPEGYGDQHPVASNDTEEGRAQNRRIALRVTEK